MSEKDVMDEAMDDEIDDTEELTGEEDDLKEKDESSKEDKPEESIESLAAKVDALAKEKDGILKELLSTRQAKHELKGKIDAITEMMAAAKASRDEMITAGAEEAAAGIQTSDGIPVSWDADGNPYIAKKDMPKMMDSAEIAELKKELAAIKNQSFHQQATDQNQRILYEVIGGDERYMGAYTRVQQAYQYLDSKADAVMKEYGLNLQTTNMDEVMGLLEKEYGEEFAEHFPGLDIDVIVEACTAGPNGLLRPRKVAKALKAAIVDGDNSTNQKIKNLKFMASKPSNLSGARNQKGTAGRTLNDIANMDVKDFENMSDADFKKLERAIARMSG